MEKPFTFILLSALTPLIVHILSSVNYYWDYAEGILSEDPSVQLYDFIIVGAGSSGSILAYRLSVQKYKVLLIEGGGDPIAVNSIPSLALDLLGYSQHDWNYKSVRQQNVALSHHNQIFSHSRGKILGGSSTINFMMYLRGHPNDYDNWANLTGDEDWNYENVLPFFKKSIYEYKGHFQENKKHYGNSPYGFLTIDGLKWDRMLGIFNDAGRELGYESDIDVNGPQVEGVGRLEATQQNGARVSSYAAIQRHIKSLQTLKITKYSQATKVNLDKSGNAVSVDYYRHGTKYKARASKEIILSAGAFDSPKLLMLSGIGPKEHLSTIGIKSKVNLPVGQNLQDHFGVFLIPFTTKEGSSFFFERDIGTSVLFEYLQKGTGIMTVTSAMTGQFFFSSSQVGGRHWPNIQTFFVPVSPSKLVAEQFGKAMSLKKEVFSEFIDPVHGKDGFLLMSTLGRPKSRGQVTLRDSDPFSDPLIGIRESLKLTNTKSFQKVDTKYWAPYFSKCGSHDHMSKAYWECYIRHTAISIWHPVGTCKMSRQDDPTAVVDSKLRVLGVKSLRVVDGSIMPFIVNANTNAPCMMIGEKGSEFILDHWASQFLVSHPLHQLIPDENKCYYAQKSQLRSKFRFEP